MHRKSIWLKIKRTFRYFLSSFRSILATSVKAEIISENIRWETSANVFLPDSVVWIYVSIFFCGGKSENDLSVRNLASHYAWTFI